MRYNKDYKIKKIEELSVSYGIDVMYVRQIAMTNDYDMLAVVDKLNRLTRCDDSVLLLSESWNEYLKNNG